MPRNFNIQAVSNRLKIATSFVKQEHDNVFLWGSTGSYKVKEQKTLFFLFQSSEIFVFTCANFGEQLFTSANVFKVFSNASFNFDFFFFANYLRRELWIFLRKEGGWSPNVRHAKFALWIFVEGIDHVESDLFLFFSCRMLKKVSGNAVNFLIIMIFWF